MGLAPDPSLLEEKLGSLQIVGIVYDGRSGSVFLQSLFDGHPQVLTTPATVLTTYFEFWSTHGQEPLNDLIDRFCDCFATLFDSTADSTDCRLNELGPGRNEKIQVDRGRFREMLEPLLRGSRVDRRRFFVAVHLAYALCLSQEVEHKSLLVYALHEPDDARRLRWFGEDFPDGKILLITRDPRAGYASFVRHLVTRQDLLLGPHAVVQRGRLLNIVYAHAIDGPRRLATAIARARVRVVRLEDLHRDGSSTMRRTAAWLDVPFHASLLESTFNGMLWWGDITRPPLNGFSQQVFSDSWRSDYYWRDLCCLEFVLRPRMQAYGYTPSIPDDGLARTILVPFLIPLPTRWEMQRAREFLSPAVYPRLFEAARRHAREWSPRMRPPYGGPGFELLLAGTLVGLDAARAARSLWQYARGVVHRWWLFYGAYWDAMRGRAIVFDEI